ncbi:MAG: C25 family cysteine peptidase [Bacteroidota bacterium]
MKRSIAFLFLLFAFNSLIAQPYGNEWINYNQNYFKFKIAHDGVYKISYAELSNAGFPVASTNPKNIQIFGRGVEIPVYIEGESDNVFNSSDFIEFYAQRNDGWFDKETYDIAANHLNPHYSLINDTATYYITWNTSLNNRRLVVENDVAFGSYPTENYFLKESTNYHADVYCDGYEDVFGSTDPEPSEGEGYTGNWFPKNTNFTENLSTKNSYGSGPDAIFKTKVVAVTIQRNNELPDNRIRLTIPAVGYQVLDNVFKGVETLDYQNLVVPLNKLGATSTSFLYQSVDMFTPNAGYMSVPFATLVYPHTFDMEGATTFDLTLPINTSSAKSTLSFSNFSTTSTVRFYDLTNGRRMTATNVSGEYKVVSQNFGTEKKCFLFSDNEVKSVLTIKPVTTSQRFVDYFSIGSSSDFILLTAKQYLLKANEYATYRNTKGYTSLVVDADDLYDQFGFGINKHPIAFRKFSEFVVDKWLQQPKGILIIGKGLEPKTVRNGDYQNINVIPTMGYPGTDGLLFARVNGLQFVPSIPYGRIAAQNSGEIDNYLNKVKSYEQQAPGLWMKSVLHFGGGANAFEQGLIKNNLKVCEDIVEDTYYGANVFNFYKTSSEPIQITTSDSLKNILETGSSILNFYGHAAGSGFDQNIDDPSVYNWNGRYPLIIANSCYIGNIHRLNNSTQSAYNERFVLGQNMGSIGFLAQTGTGILQILAVYSKNLYENFSKNLYGESIGRCYQETVRQIQTNDYFVKSACLEISLHGDPVIKLNTQNKPDYSITVKDVFYTPKNISTVVDSFDVNLIVSNIGKADDDSLTIEIKRFLPNLAEPKLYFKTVQSPNYKDTIVLRLPIDNANGIGFNDLEIFLDPVGEHDELREDNNQIKVRFFIRSDDISPVYPYKYAVIPANTVKLVATTGDPFSTISSYVMEMDVTDLFNSSFKITKTVTQEGGVVKFDPGITFTDSTVYFWRVAKVPTDGEAYRWKESSFQYIKDKSGWGQAHFFQYKDNDFNFINYDRTSLKFKFSENKKKLTVKTWVDPPGPTQYYATEILLDNSVLDYGSCGASAAILVTIIDPKTLEPWGTRFYNNETGVWQNPNNNFGNANDNLSTGACNRIGIDHRFVFHTSSLSGMQGLKDMLENKVPNGHYIVAYTFGRGNFQSWAEPATINTFENLGANIATVPNDKGWAFVVKKGDVTTAKQVLGGPGNVLITLEDTLQCDWNFGKVTSEIVGPALRWDEFIWKPTYSESPNYDSTRAKIIGVKNNGSEVVLFNNILPSTVNTSLSTVSALDYPLLKLQMYTKDDTSKTPSQLRRWHVLYQEAPESAVAPNLFARRPPTNVNEGESVSFATAIENISSSPMDSLLITYWIEDKDRNIKTLKTEYLDSLRVGDTLHTSVTFSSNNLPGLNSLWLEVNPKNATTGFYDQLEQYHFNNFALFEINVKPDKTNPILDVTFDGIHIMDGDIVSAKPNIVMQLNDENKYKALSDTSFFAVYLKHPNQELLERLYFNSAAGEIMKFTPATLPANKAKIEYNPTLFIDGVYELQVQGKDASSNKSGDVEYKVKFEVINKSTITQVLNYPNPFSTSTRFVFTLTGSEVPTFMKIQIMTVTGKVVREITESELGPIRVGRNITEYAWDGKDEFGDPLANGVYLYKVYARINGENIEKRATSSDQYFTKGVGKMYLMR